MDLIMTVRLRARAQVAPVLLACSVVLAACGSEPPSHLVAGTAQGATPIVDPGIPATSTNITVVPPEKRGFDQSKIPEGRAEFSRRYRTWLAEQNGLDLDLRRLPRGELAASYFVPTDRPDFATAVRRAEVVVLGVVEDIEFQAGRGDESTFPSPYVVVRMRVAASTKGAWPGTVVEFAQAGALWPAPDWSPKLAFGIDNPLLLPGDRALVLLERGADYPGHPYYVPGFTGQFSIDATGRAKAVNFNPFAAEVDGMPEARLLAMAGAA
ncbi:MAG: hypothetical protein ACRD0D_08320 [Acidimicrobiales bacterium]